MKKFWGNRINKNLVKPPKVNTSEQRILTLIIIIINFRPDDSEIIFKLYHHYFYLTYLNLIKTFKQKYIFKNHFTTSI